MVATAAVPLVLTGVVQQAPAGPVAPPQERVKEAKAGLAPPVLPGGVAGLAIKGEGTLTMQDVCVPGADTSTLAAPVGTPVSSEAGSMLGAPDEASPVATADGGSAGPSTMTLTLSNCSMTLLFRSSRSQYVVVMWLCLFNSRQRIAYALGNPYASSSRRTSSSRALLPEVPGSSCNVAASGICWYHAWARTLAMVNLWAGSAVSRPEMRSLTASLMKSGKE